MAIISTLYLISDINGTLYRVESDMETERLVAIDGLTESDLTANVFQEYGFTELPHSTTLLLELTAPTLYKWKSQGIMPVVTAMITGIPHAQTVTARVDMSHPSITGIEGVSIVETGSPLYAVRFGDDEAYYAYDGESWSLLSDELSGMTAAVFSAISFTAWSEKLLDVDYITVRFTLFDESDRVQEIKIDFAN